jgi:hypothetical protein
MGRDGSVHKLEPSSRIMDGATPGSHMYKKILHFAIFLIPFRITAYCVEMVFGVRSKAA